MNDRENVENEYIRSLMCEVPQFDSLEQEEIDVLVDAVIHRTVPGGTILTREGNRGDSLFYIVAGRIEIQKESVDGKHTVMARFNKGASVGEMSLVEDSPRSATAIALDDVELLIISKKDFDALIENHPLIGLKIMRNIARSLSTRLRYTSGRFADMVR